MPVRDIVNGPIKQGIEKARVAGEGALVDAAQAVASVAADAAGAVAGVVAGAASAAVTAGDAAEQRIAVLVDSATDVPASAVERYNVHIVPLHVNYSDGDYLDRATIQPEEVYVRFATEVPKTSTPAPADVMAAFDRIAAEGYTRVVAVTIASGLSGTYELVRSIAAGRADMECAVVDTKSIGIGAGLTALAACEFVDEGMLFAQVVKRAREVAD